jgi:hypothetical protein
MAYHRRRVEHDSIIRFELPDQRGPPPTRGDALRGGLSLYRRPLIRALAGRRRGRC